MTRCCSNAIEPRAPRKAQNVPKAKAPPAQVLAEAASSTAPPPAAWGWQYPRRCRSLPTFGNLPYAAQPIGLMQVPATQGPAAMQAPIAPQPSAASSSTWNFSVPVRGRDVPRRQSTAQGQASAAWRPDRAGNTWQDDRQQSRDRAWRGYWWQGWRDEAGTTTGHRPADAERSRIGMIQPKQRRASMCNAKDGNGRLSSTRPSCAAVADDRATRVRKIFMCNSMHSNALQSHAPRVQLFYPGSGE